MQWNAVHETSAQKAVYTFQHPDPFQVPGVFDYRKSKNSCEAPRIKNSKNFPMVHTNMPYRSNSFPNPHDLVTELISYFTVLRSSLSTLLSVQSPYMAVGQARGNFRDQVSCTNSTLLATCHLSTMDYGRRVLSARVDAGPLPHFQASKAQSSNRCLLWFVTQPTPFNGFLSWYVQ